MKPGLITGISAHDLSRICIDPHKKNYFQVFLPFLTQILIKPKKSSASSAYVGG
jgi:hypothetical protein